MLKLLSLNIEHFRHLDAVTDFLATEMPDVACLHEVCEPDVARLRDSLNASHATFAPLTIWPEPRVVIGSAILSRLPARNESVAYYHGNPENIQILDYTTVIKSNETKQLPLLALDTEKDGTVFKVATTHFTWTPDGMPDGQQREDLKKLLGLLKPMGEFVLCGDFNAPRGFEIFDELATRFKDNIPLEYKTSLDNSKHRIGPKKFKQAGMDHYMVDGLFTTPAYHASHVELRFGISDHAGILASIQKQ